MMKRVTQYNSKTTTYTFDRGEAEEALEYWLENKHRDFPHNGDRYSSGLNNQVILVYTEDFTDDK